MEKKEFLSLPALFDFMGASIRPSIQMFQNLLGQFLHININKTRKSDWMLVVTAMNKIAAFTVTR